MVKKNRILVFSLGIMLAISSLVSCSFYPENFSLVNNEKLNKYSIKGKAEFNSYKLKATASDVAQNATVSLIYPLNYSVINLRNKTIASGLTNEIGVFMVNPDTGFIPEINKVYILEAARRINGTGTDLIAIRTNVKWTGNNWESITKNTIYINKKTTALSIMADFYSSSVLPESTINKLIQVNNDFILDSNDSNLKLHFDFVCNLVERAIFNNIDPIRYSNASNTDYWHQSNSPDNTLSRNMSAFQILLETYSVDWGGLYPKNIDELTISANQGNYNTLSQIFDAYHPDIKRPQTFLEYDKYEKIKNIVRKDDLKGLILFKTGGELAPAYLTRYWIYGLNDLGELLTRNGSILYLSNQ
jgi:hypothetical protein